MEETTEVVNGTATDSAGLLDYQQWSNVVINTLTDFGQKTVGYIPNVVGAILILLLGWIISLVVQLTLQNVLKAIGLDRVSTKTKLDLVLKKAKIKQPISYILARIAFWILFLIFAISALETLGLEVVSESLNALIFYIPNVFAAIVIIVLGALIAGFANDITVAAAASADLAYGKTLGRIAYFVIILFMVIIAVSQLGIDTRLFTANITLIIAGFVAAGTLAFGLGGKALAANLMAYHYIEEMFDKGDKVNIDGKSMKIKQITKMAVIVETKEGPLVISNSKFLKGSCC